MSVCSACGQTVTGNVHLCIPPAQMHQISINSSALKKLYSCGSAGCGTCSKCTNGPPPLAFGSVSYHGSWDPTTVYQKDDIVENNGVLWRWTATPASGIVPGTGAWVHALASGGPAGHPGHQGPTGIACMSPSCREPKCMTYRVRRKYGFDALDDASHQGESMAEIMFRPRGS